MLQKYSIFLCLPWNFRNSHQNTHAHIHVWTVQQLIISIMLLRPLPAIGSSEHLFSLWLSSKYGQAIVDPQTLQLLVMTTVSHWKIIDAVADDGDDDNDKSENIIYTTTTATQTTTTTKEKSICKQNNGQYNVSSLRMLI